MSTSDPIDHILSIVSECKSLAETMLKQADSAEDRARQLRKSAAEQLAKADEYLAKAREMNAQRSKEADDGR